ncbi:MAG: hypothetical protein H6606_09975 [Flavobacteriales bacterium]|nr:hypothetical protein [Flavobacteriales bacterium]
MYTTILALHSILRWALLGLLIYVFVRSITGLMHKRDFVNGDRKQALFLMILADLNLLLGFLLYLVFSPLTKAAFNDFGAAMKDSNLRFWAVEHIAAMLLAIVLIHAAYSIAKKPLESGQKFKKIAVTTGAALLFILSRIPWEAARLDLVW